MAHHDVLAALHYPIDRAPQPVKVDRFCEMLNEAGLVASADVFFHSVAGERDSADGELGEQLSHEVVSGAVGKAKVADQQIQSLGLRDLKWLRPVYADDTIMYESEVIETRVSESRPNLGLVTVRSTGVNQRGEPVLSFISTTFLERRPVSK